MQFQKKITFWIILLLLVILSLIAQSAENVQITGFVNDYASIISPEHKYQIEGILKNLYDNKIAEFSVVTIGSLEGQDIESYALNLAQGKLGDKEKNNGLLLLVAVQDRKYRFEVGRGLEPILNDAKVGRIGRTYLVENFRKEEYGKGIYEATLAVERALKGESGPEDKKNIVNENIIAYIAVLIFIILIFFALILPFILKVREYKKKKTGDKLFDAALLAALLFRGHGRSGGHGGFSGGGFGGFGGGGFGGGGAGSGW